MVNVLLSSTAATGAERGRAPAQRQGQPARAAQARPMQQSPAYPNWRRQGGNAAPGPPANPNKGGAVQRGSRMTPEERKALRQQIDDAGRDVYRNRAGWR